eukprot:11862765-Heterocapsa_arctica.AAC.1
MAHESSTADFTMMEPASALVLSTKLVPKTPARTSGTSSAGGGAAASHAGENGGCAGASAATRTR